MATSRADACGVWAFLHEMFHATPRDPAPPAARRRVFARALAPSLKRLMARCGGPGGDPGDGPNGRRLVRLALAASSLIVGCGVLTLIPMDEIRVGNPAGRLFSWEHPTYRERELNFSHEVHSDFKCESCHPTGLEREAVRAGGLPSMARCIECHDGTQASSGCETCHQLQRKDRRPPSHDAAWQHRHGRAAEGQEFQCAICHSESSCQGCHSTRKPQSHTLRWLRSTHGRTANHERGNCAVCHDADFCAECHSRPPPDHTPTFMGTGGHKQVARLRTRSCLTCHRFQETCARCHG